MTRVIVQDLRTARYCLAGARGWFKRQGIAWDELLAGGVEAERLRATGDALVEPVIRAAEARERAERIQSSQSTESPDGR